MIGDKKNRSAFTLVEALVVMGIFAVLVTLITEIYLRTMRSGEQVVLRSRLQSDARFGMEAVARAVRVSNIDYPSYGGTLPAQPTADLHLINPATGATAAIRAEDTDSGCWNDAKSFPCVVVSTDGGTAWTPLTPAGVRLERLRFYSDPPNDPYLFDPNAGTYSADRTPLIVISLAVRGLAARASDEWVYDLQTAATPRLYLR